MAQGVALGAILQGIHVEGRHYGGGWWDWLTPFSILTGLSVVVGYALLGATWLVMKTEGELRDEAYRLSWWLLFAMIAAMGAVSLATPFLHIQYTNRWFTWPSMILTAPVPIAVAGVTLLLLRSLANKQDYRPFFLTLALFGLSYAGLGISMYPYIVPQSIDHLAGGIAREQPDLHAVRRRHPDTDDSRLYRVGLLRISRQGETRERLPLTPPAQKPAPLVQRLLWFVGALARRRRHGCHRGIWNKALDRAEIGLLPAPIASLTQFAGSRDLAEVIDTAADVNRESFR